jgi:hypothetical protein
VQAGSASVDWHLSDSRQIAIALGEQAFANAASFEPDVPAAKRQRKS